MNLLLKANRVSSSNSGYHSSGGILDVIQTLLAWRHTEDPLISTKVGYLSNHRNTCDILICPITLSQINTPLNSSTTTFSWPWYPHHQILVGDLGYACMVASSQASLDLPEPVRPQNTYTSFSVATGVIESTWILLNDA